MCSDPQLVVVKGLLLERKNSILRTRLARASYGVIIEQPYSKRYHFSQQMRLDPLNQKKYVTDQIEWLVKRGDKISADKTFSITIERRAALGDPRQWIENIVWSENGEHWLPRNMTERESLLLKLLVLSSQSNLDSRGSFASWGITNLGSSH
jgi:hypothetical protein